MFTQQLIAGFFEAPSLWIPAFMAIDKLHWLPIHSLMLMFDMLDCRPMFSVLSAHSWPRLLSKIMSGSALPFVGKMVIIMCIWLYLQILFKYRPSIKYKYAHFCDFQLKYIKFWYSNTNTYLKPNLLHTAGLKSSTTVWVCYTDMC